MASATVFEPQPRSGNEVREHPGDQDLAWAGQGHGPRGDVHGDPGDLVPERLGLSHMKTGPDLDPHLSDPMTDCGGAPHCLGWFGEGREEPVPGRVQLPAVEMLELPRTIA